MANYHRPLLYAIYLFCTYGPSRSRLTDGTYSYFLTNVACM